MTTEQMEALLPAFDDYLQQFLFCCGYTQTFDLFNIYCHGLLSDLDRKTCEPIALQAGVAVRTVQEFLRDHVWSFAQARQTLQSHVASLLTDQSEEDDLGTVGIIDETGTVKKGTKTPGVQRQWCGEVGKKENCIVTVHLGVAYARFKTLVDFDLYLPLEWAQDRARCEAAQIPDTVVFRTKWRIALDQVDRARGNGLTLDWLTFDEEYGKAPDFLTALTDRRLLFVGEVPKSFRCFTSWPRRGEAGHRADNLVRHSPAFHSQQSRRFRLRRQTLGDQVWDVKAAQVWLSVDGRPSARTYWLIWARNCRTGEVKYFVSNAPARTSLRRLLRVAFRRWNVEHSFRVSKGEVGLRHFEGQSYVALMRHLALCCVTLTFAARQAERLRGEKSGGDHGAGLRSAERGDSHVAGDVVGNDTAATPSTDHSVSPAA